MNYGQLKAEKRREVRFHLKGESLWSRKGWFVDYAPGLRLPSEVIVEDEESKQYRVPRAYFYFVDQVPKCLL